MIRLPTKKPPKTRPTTSVHLVLSPAFLDRLADAELQHGLAHRAAELRDAQR